MSITLKQLEAFVWVADMASFRGAADRLNTTQPNISARIAALEAKLGTSLMERDAGSVRLTPKGAELLDHARGILRATEAMQAASGNAARIEGTLRLGVTEMVAHTWLGPYLRRLSADFPNIHVELTVELSVKLEADLADRSLDLALQNAPFDRHLSGEIPLGSYSMIWVAAPGLDIPSGVNLSAEDIAAHPILTHARDTRLYAETSAHFGGVKASQPRLVPSSNLSACIHMTINGMGVATVPAGMVRTELERGALVRLDYAWTPEPLAFFARFDAERAAGFVADAARLAAETARDWADEG